MNELEIVEMNSPPREDGKPRIWKVQDGTRLFGRIAWCSPYRKYIFMPMPGFQARELSDDVQAQILEFCEEKTGEFFREMRAFRSRELP